MSAIVTELYDALRNCGAEENMARHAAEAVLGSKSGLELATKAELLATKADLKAEMQELKAELRALRAELTSGLKNEAGARQIAMANLTADLIKWNVGAMAALTAIFAAIVRFG